MMREKLGNAGSKALTAMRKRDGATRSMSFTTRIGLVLRIVQVSTHGGRTPAATMLLLPISAEVLVGGHRFCCRWLLCCGIYRLLFHHVRKRRRLVYGQSESVRNDSCYVFMCHECDQWSSGSIHAAASGGIDMAPHDNA